MYHTNKPRSEFIKQERRKYIKLLDEYNRLCNAKYDRNASLVELEKPILKGYKKFFVIRPDFAEGNKSSILKKLLPLLQTIVYSHDKLFLRKDEKTKKKVPIKIGLSDLSRKEWNMLDDKEQRYFERYLKREKYTKQKVERFRFKFPYMFITKIDKHYITHVRMVNKEVESRTAELSDFLWRKDVGKTYKYVGIRSNRDYDRKSLDDLKGEQIEQEAIKEI